jgi:hypothetical protein
MTAGFEPVPSALTGQDTDQLCYVTMFLLWCRDSNPDSCLNGAASCR